jgi:hypothetical protein
MIKYNTITSCRLCKKNELEIVMDFGLSPLANSYPSSQTDNEDVFPLTVSKCRSCGHVQLNETVNPEILFSEYSYASSDSPSLVSHFKEYANTVTSEINLDKKDSILEIGSNDGILLKQLISLEYTNIYGVEPAANIAERSYNIGAAKIFNDFFTFELSKIIKTELGNFKLICANNVFAHVADIDSMVQGISNLLDEDGVFVFENAYLLDTIKGLYFDQVYHEHLQYYGIKPLVEYLKNYDLSIFHIKRVSTQGGSFRIYTQKISSGKREVRDSVQKFLDAEEELDLYNNNTFDNFSNQIKTLSQNVSDFIQNATKENKTICCYGCPAKFALFSKVFNLSKDNIKYVVDDSPLKQNKYSPGSKIPIVNKKYFYDYPTDYCIVSVWNMADSIIKNNKEFTGKFLIPMPNFKLVTDTKEIK